MRGGMFELTEGGQRFPRGHLLRPLLGPAATFAVDGSGKANRRRVFAPVSRSGRGDDLIMGRREIALLGNLLEPALVVVVRPRLHVDEAAAENAIGGPISLIQENGPDDRLKGVGQDGLQRSGTRLVGALAQQQVIAQTEPRSESGQALGIHHGRAQAGELTFIGRAVGVKEVLRRNQLQDRIAQILQPFVVGQAALRVLVDVGAVGQGLT